LKHDLAYKELLRAPVNVTWEIAGSCNLRCRHCLSADLMAHCGAELDFGQCCRIIDDLDRIGVFQINFGGGEPFLREDFLDILDYAHKKSITTCVSTNGTLLDERIAARLKSMEMLYIQVSLDGATAATNDRIRGVGTFEKIVAGVELLARAGLPGLSTNTVVTGINIHEIAAIYEFGKRRGVKTRLSRFRPSGSARRVWTEFHLERAALAEVSQFLGTHRDIATGDSFFSIAAENRRDLGLNMCGAARMTCSIAPDGRVYPCAFLQDDVFLAGNAATQSLESMWQTARSFNTMRSIRIESCGSCARYHQCHGGCPAVAYFLTKSLNHSDPECMMQFGQTGAAPSIASEMGSLPILPGALDHVGTV
jgi:mycofactocin radical SAM maturase